MLFKDQKLTALPPALSGLVEEAYRRFADYEIDLPLRVCRCPVCVGEDAARALVKTPLRLLPSAVLADYTNSAHGYDEASDGATFRHYLPRYLELIALNDPPDRFDLQYCLQRLRMAEYRSRWLPAEADLIDRYFDALLTDKLADVSLTRWPVGYRLAFPLDDLLEMFVLAGADLPRLLGVFAAAPDPGAAAHMASLARNLLFAGAPDLHSVMLEDHPAARRAIAAFLAGQADRLEGAFFMLDGEPELQREVSEGQQMIEGIAAAWSAA